MQPPEPTPEPEPEPVELATIAGCPSQCLGGCAFPGSVIGTRLDTGDVVLPVGNSCTTAVPVGVQVRLEATVNRGFEFIRWANVNNWDPCPCAEAVDPVCVVTATEASAVYCGAVYAEAP
jgi:hypothetical protein